jgi:hypothetical protein
MLKQFVGNNGQQEEQHYGFVSNFFFQGLGQEIPALTSNW